MQAQPKPEPAPRMAAIVQAAAYAFALAGYHRTQMSDIAARAQVALGTLYRHADSKEDLFAYALAFGAGGSLSDVTQLTPVRDVEAYFASQLSTWFAPDDFSARLYQGETPVGLGEAFAALYDLIGARRLTIRIVDRSAHDLPLLGEAYSRHVREPVLTTLTRFLRTLEEQGATAPMEDAAASARLALEVCAWFAMHRLFSPGGAMISDALARATALSHLTAAFRRQP